MNLIQQIAMLGTFGEVFLLKAFFAGTLDKISDFKIVFKIIFFFGHCWRPFFASINFLVTRFYRNLFIFLESGDIQPSWQMPSPPVPEWDKTPP